jgi:hypothetical protein
MAAFSQFLRAFGRTILAKKLFNCSIPLKTMKEDAFTRAMNKIVVQAEAEQKRDLELQKRAQFMGRVRAVVVFLLGVAAIAVVINYREPISKAILPKKESPLAAVVSVTNADGTVTTTPVGRTSQVVNQAQQNAATRDAIINQISK